MSAIKYEELYKISIIRAIFTSLFHVRYAQENAAIR